MSSMYCGQGNRCDEIERSFDGKDPHQKSRTFPIAHYGRNCGQSKQGGKQVAERRGIRERHWNACICGPWGEEHQSQVSECMQ